MTCSPGMPTSSPETDEFQWLRRLNIADFIPDHPLTRAKLLTSAGRVQWVMPYKWDVRSVTGLEAERRRLCREMDM